MKKQTKKALSMFVLFLVILLTGLFINGTIDVIDPQIVTIDEFPSINSSRSFSVIVLPDTQNYSANYPEIFCKQTDWILAMKEKLNIVFVSHMGDIVNDGAEKMHEWETASNCMGKLDSLVPYGIIPGNHDLDIASVKSSGFSAYNTYFPLKRFENKNWYGGSYLDYRNNYQKIKIDEATLLFLNLEIEPSDKVLSWAKEVVKKNPDTYTILTTHKYLPINLKNRDNNLRFSDDGNTGEGIWNKLVYNNCSIRQVWSGHFHGENHIVSKNVCGKDVYQIVQDYQEREKGGNGWLRIYTFNPKENNVQVSTYSPLLNQKETDNDSEFSFYSDIR